MAGHPTANYYVSLGYKLAYLHAAELITENAAFKI